VPNDSVALCLSQVAPSWQPWQDTRANGQCAAFLRTACDPTSVFAKIPTMVAFNGSVKLGLGRIVTSHHRSATLYQIH
jgi:hypothetical protein